MTINVVNNLTIKMKNHTIVHMSMVMNELGFKQWVLDNDATSHMTKILTILGNPFAYNGDESVLVGNGHSLTIANTYDSRIVTSNISFSLKDVLYALNLSTNFISIQDFCSNNNVLIEFHSNYFYMKDMHTKKIFHQRQLDKNLFKLID